MDECLAIALPVLEKAETEMRVSDNKHWKGSDERKLHTKGSKTRQDFY